MFRHVRILLRIPMGMFDLINSSVLHRYGILATKVFEFALLGRCLRRASVRRANWLMRFLRLRCSYSSSENRWSTLRRVY